MTAVDWSARPEPWRSIAPRLIAECKAECKAIMAGKLPPSMKPAKPLQHEPRLDLVERRHRLGMTQRELGGLTGYTRSSVNEVERGRGTKGMAARIEAALARAEAERESR